MANPYKTHWYNRRISHWLNKEVDRPAGHVETPEVIRLAPTAEPSDAPPVRIFLGTEPGQYRATRVFVWSVLKHRDPARAYEVHLMSDLAGIPRKGWKTGFTNYRYLIPWLAGETGRAIYNDVDQIYLSDPARLFDMDMHGKGVLAISEAENSVMLIDCAVMARHWTREAVAAGKGHAHFKGVMSANGLFGEMPESWNSRDGAVPLGQTDCLHYTTLHTQPWKPFPGLLRYGESPLAGAWHGLEREADEAGYLLFTRERPTREAGELAAQQQRMHNTAAGPDAAKLRKHGRNIAGLIREHGARTLLDCGGRAGDYQPLPGSDGLVRQNPDWPRVAIRCCDLPGLSGRGDAAHDGQRDDAHDGAIAIGFLERLAPFDVPWAIEEMFRRASGFVYVAVACHPARGTLPDGRNANTVLQPPYWWHSQMALAARRHPQVDWVLVCETRTATGKGRKVFDRGSSDPLA